MKKSFFFSLNGLGQSGDAFISSAGDLTLSNVTILSDAKTPLDAGDVSISSPRAIRLVDSQVFTDSSSTGNGGSINIRNAQNVSLVRTELATRTAGEGSAGNIVFENIGFLRLQEESVLLADASGNADGGAITIESDFVVANPDGNNDIIVNSEEGSGGEITIMARGGVFGLAESSGLTVPELRANDSSDISASSRLGAEGMILLDTLVSDPNESLNDLDDDFVDSNQFVAATCSRRNRRSAGDFTIPGSGGLLPSPENYGASVYPIGDVQRLPSDTAAETPPWQLGDPVREPETVTRLATGVVVFGRHCEPL